MPKRSASASIAGYHYQFARTALCWLQSRRDDLLYCESNEDVDLVADDGSVQEVQVKLRKRSWTERSQGLREVVANFAQAFCAHHEEGRRCSFVFTSSAAFAPKEQKKSVLGRWFMGKRTDAAQLRAELTSVVGWSCAAYLERTDAWRTFSESVIWDFSAGQLSELRDRLLRAIATSKRAHGLDPQAVMAAMLQRVFDRAGASDIGERSLSSVELDVLINDLWLSKGVEQFDILPGGSVAILGSVTHGRNGKACVALFIDGIDELEAEYRSAVDRDRSATPGCVVQGLVRRA